MQVRILSGAPATAAHSGVAQWQSIRQAQALDPWSQTRPIGPEIEGYLDLTVAGSNPAAATTRTGVGGLSKPVWVWGGDPSGGAVRLMHIPPAYLARANTSLGGRSSRRALSPSTITC